MVLRFVALVASLAVTGAMTAETIVVGPGETTPEIQPAIDAARDGDRVLVKPGEYVIDAPIDFNRLHDPSDPASPPVKNLVVESEGGAEATKIRRRGSPEGPGPTSVVVFENGEALTSALNGFTLEGGGYGGGVVIWRSSPTITGCTITANSGVGVICDQGTNATIINCTIRGNSAALSGAVACRNVPSMTLMNCTITGNLGSGVYSFSSSPKITNCIMWDNSRGSVFTEGTGQPVITYSCIESDAPFPGEGNIAGDPLWCGWLGRDEVWVDPSRPGPGDGSEANPYLDVRAATTGYSLALSMGSPCRGSGMGGADMGSDTGSCAGPADRARTVHLAQGTYPAGDLDLVHRVSLLGAGEEKTVIEGTLRDLRSGSRFSDFTVIGNRDGGLVIDSGQNPAISNCTISGSSSRGVACLGINSSPTFTNCTISGTSGTGMYCISGSSPTLTSCEILGNAIGLYLNGSSATLTDCTISGNRSGLSFVSGSSPVLIGCTISGNSGGGLNCQGDCSPTLTNCTITGNLDGGVDCRMRSSPTLTNCTISGNRGALSGGLTLVDRSSPTLMNCTIAGNSAFGVYCTQSCNPILTNCIVWEHSAGSIRKGTTNQPVISYSCIEGEPVWEGEGNINQNPLFCGGWKKQEVWVNPARADPGDGSEANPFSDPRQATREYLNSLALSAGSPCRGRGQGRSDMGSDNGRCESPRARALTVHLAPATYRTEDFDLTNHVSLLGAGEGTTVLEGTVRNLRTSSLLSNLSVTQGKDGGIRIDARESPRIASCTISGNSPEPSSWFGVFCESNSSPEFTNCTISRNGGFGVYCEESSTPTMNNCTISGNSYGGMVCLSAKPVLVNCTISGNQAGRVGEGLGGAIYWKNAFSPTLTSCIVWNNAGGSLVNAGGEEPVVTYSCIEGLAGGGEGNIAKDPLFCGWIGGAEVWVDPASTANGDGSEANPYSDTRDSTIRYSLALSEKSPCLGTGKSGVDMGSSNGKCGGSAGSARTVHLAEGTYHSEDFNLLNRVSLRGSGESMTMIEGTVRNLSTDSSLSRLTVTLGEEGGIVIDSGASPEINSCTISGNIGSGIDCRGNSSAKFTNCTISGNSAGLLCSDSSPTLTGCRISGNSGNGVACQEDSFPILTNCLISGNIFGGVSIFNGSAPTLDNCTISGTVGFPPGFGGGVYCELGSSATLTHCTVSGNLVIGLFLGGDSSATLTSCIVWDNLGGSVVNQGTAQPAIIDSCLEGEPVWPGEGNINQDPLFCGGWDRAVVWVDPSRAGPGDGSEGDPYSDPRRATAEYSSSLALATGSPARGSGNGGSDMGSDNGSCGAPLGKALTIHLAPGTYPIEDFDLFHKVSLLGSGEGTTVIEGTVRNLRTGALLSNLTATRGVDVGVQVAAGESPEITHCTLSASSGIGFQCLERASPTLTHCTISGNPSHGLLINENSNPFVSHCTISGNSYLGVYCASAAMFNDCEIAGNSHGGIFCVYASPTLTNCTISGNLNSGVSCAESSSPSLMNCTISANTGAGVQSFTAFPTLTNCIAWNNQQGSVAWNGDRPTITYSCIESKPIWPGEGNINRDPQFEGPGDYHLKPQSPAIDTGTSAGAPITDIEGHRRPCGAGVDMGAYEFGDCHPPVRFKRGKVEGSGDIELNDVMVTLKYLFVGQDAITCLDSADSNGDGRLNIVDPIYSLMFLEFAGSPPSSPFPACGYNPTIDGLDCKQYKACE